MAYLRVSTDDQRLGPDAQRAAIEVWASREGVTVLAWHVDQGVSGGSDIDDRPGLVAALGELRAGSAGVLLVAKRDRLARDVYVASMIERAVAQSGARVVSADGTPVCDLIALDSDGECASPLQGAKIEIRTVGEGVDEVTEVQVLVKVPSAFAVGTRSLAPTGSALGPIAMLECP